MAMTTSRSERKRTPHILKAICELVRNGLSCRHAAEKLHIHHTTIGRWRRELPDFEAAILAAEAEFIEAQVANIRIASKTNWQASAWLLERRYPEFYSQPQVRLHMSGPKDDWEDLQTLMDRVKQSSGRGLLVDEPLEKAVLGKEVPPLALPDATSQEGG